MALRKMAPITKKKEKQQEQEDKQALLKMALLAWSHAIFTKADQVCGKNGAYAHQGRGCYMEVLTVLEKTLEELDTLKPNAMSSSKAGCQTDDECADDYICVGGDCLAPAPPEFYN
jgi:hypothetical protein